MYMSSLSPRLHKAYKSRCVSLPVRSHPSVRRIQEVVSKVRALGSSSLDSRTMVRDGLSGLTDLYRCLSEDLFRSSPETQQALLNGDGLMDELLEVSLKYLEVCGGAKDVASKIKKSVVELQSALRRSKKGGDFSLESDVDAYMASMKEIKKEIKKYSVMSKETDASLESVWCDGDDQDMNALVRVMQETSVMTCFVLRSVFSFLSSPKGLKTKNHHRHKGWGIVMKLVKKGIDHHNQEKRDLEKGFSCLELEAMETELGKLVVMTTSEDQEEETKVSEEVCETIQCALVRSVGVETVMEELEDGLEGLFKVMIQARVSLLNILSI
ncbi:hypothetical protein CARUB_v10005236mg [Capsella rubella]|uniref:DUF241 domain-containing protein n=1 Tax=Capsella rubella TaxID=81985 RepID=R0GJG9_9BRAS|nr:uncharacterized protein LOC17880399 [Capsella rubella]EOA16999.1 hypothetical protein CARUB_v10005236mg [Capsella rubella]